MWSWNVVTVFHTLKRIFLIKLFTDHFRLFQGARLLTQLLSFGPIAGDAFSVSDEWISLFRSSTPSSIKLFIRFGGRDESDFLRFSGTWPFSDVFSSAGSLEKRWAYVMTMESFSIELSDGRRLRSIKLTEI